LEKNLNILEVSPQWTDTFKFKTEVVKAYKSGTSPKEIFRRTDIDLNLLSAQYAKNSIWRLVKIVENYGVEGFREENRGKNSKGRPPKKKFKSEQEEITYLRAENDFLEKLSDLEKKWVKAKGFRQSSRLQNVIHSYQ